MNRQLSSHTPPITVSLLFCAEPAIRSLHHSRFIHDTATFGTLANIAKPDREQPVKKFHAWLYIMLCLLAPLQLLGQSGAGLLGSSRYVDWSNVGATIENRTVQCGSTISAGASAATIVSALQACANSHQYVHLGTGTFNLSSTLFGAGVATPSNVTLRGDGPTKTILNWTGVTNNCAGINTAGFCIYNGDSGTLQFISNYADVTGGLTQGSTSITVGTVHLGTLSNLHVGSLLQFSQADLTTDNGNLWVCGKVPVGTDPGGGPHPSITTQGCTWGGSSNVWPGRGQFQTVRVTGISGTTVTFTPGLYAPNWSLSRTPYVGWSNNLPVVGFGLENLQINTQSMGNMEYQVNLEWVDNSWIKNVSFINNTASGGAARKHVMTLSSFRTTVRDSYFFGSSPSNEGYGVDLAMATSESLVENNIYQHIAAPEITEGAAGNVFSYHYAVDDYYTGGLFGGVPNSPNWQGCDSFHHDEGDMYNLYEGNEGICAAFDDFHGTGGFLTLFRNYYNGRDPANQCPGGGTACGTGYMGATKTQFTGAITNMGYTRYTNVVANVLGTSTYHNQYAETGVQVFPVNGGSGTCASPNQASIYELNHSDQNYIAFWSGTNCYPPSAFSPPLYLDNDPLASASMMRWGNYDTVNAAVRTVSGENGSTASTYPALSSPSTTWTSYKSLYLASQPSWWGSMPWPAVGPEVTGGDISNVGGHAYHNPAAKCYLTTLGGATNGSSNQFGASYDAAACYSSTSTVSTPSFSPTPGSYGSAQTVTLSTSTSGATICYTTDGSTPTANGAGTCTHGSIYSVPFTVSSTQTVKAIGSKSGFSDSSVASGTYTINGSAAAPTFTPPAGSYGPAQSVVIASSTSGATICYTTDGSTPTADGAGTCTAGTTYSGAVSVSTSETLKAIASKSGFTDSSVASAVYVINGTASTPTFSPVAGSYGPTQNVTISTSTSGATICYTTNGSSPTSSSPGICAAGSTQYASPVAVSSSLTLKAIASKAGFSDSSIGSAAYTINGAVASVTYSPVAGAYGTAQTVTLSSTTSSATICYTTDGSTPTTDGAGTCTHGSTYSAPFSVATSQTVTAIGTKSGFSDSSVNSAIYTINGTLPTPTFAPAAGGYGTAQSVTISAVSGSSVLMVNTMQETSNATDTIGSSVHRNTYTNCATGYSGGQLQPAGQPVGNLYCTASDKTSALANGGPNLGVVSSTISGTGTTALDNGNGAGGSDSPTSVTATYAGSTGSACGAHAASSSGYVSGLTFPDPGASAQLVYGLTTGTSGNSSILTVSKYNSNGDTGRYVAQRDCFTPNSVSVGGAHYESDFNYNTTGGTYMGFGKDYNFPTKKFRAAPQGASWINEELCPVGGGACITTFNIPSGDSLLIESYEHWDAGCTFSSGSPCAYYDALGLQLYNGGTPVSSIAYYNVRNATTHAVISFIPINKTSWTHPQYGIQHQWDINATSTTLSATVPFSTAVAYLPISGSATICYTTDGTTPTADGAGTCTHGTTYTSPITVSATTTVKAIASQSGFTDSSVGSATYTINGTAATPTFSPVAGTYAGTQLVTISSTTGGATLCYTIDGSTPTADGNGTCTHGTTYSGAVSVSASLTLQAIATEAGFTDSAVGSAAYTITSPSAPTISGTVVIKGTVGIQ